MSMHCLPEELFPNSLRDHVVKNGFHEKVLRASFLCHTHDIWHTQQVCQSPQKGLNHRAKALGKGCCPVQLFFRVFLLKLPLRYASLSGAHSHIESLSLCLEKLTQLIAPHTERSFPRLSPSHVLVSVL